MKTQFGIAFGIGTLICVTTAAEAQTDSRKWVSSSGNDANDCTREQPCLTFAGAVSKTPPFGEVDAADAGSYGPVTITKSITIDGGGVATIEVVGNTTGIGVVASNTDIVVLRNIEIRGNGTGATGVRFLGAKQLVIDHVHISGVAANGIAAIPSTQNASGSLLIMNSTISGNGPEVSMIGVSVAGGTATITGSTITSIKTALRTTGTGVINAEGNVLTLNGTAVDVSSSTVRVSNNDVYNNFTGFTCASGVVLASTGNNRKGSNTGGFATPCTPNAVITQQ